MSQPRSDSWENRPQDNPMGKVATNNNSLGFGDAVGAILSTGAQLYDSYQNRKTSKQNTQQTIQANKELSKYSYDRDLEMWRLANEYNNPSSQMQRLKAAGLNPNLAYSSGNVGGMSSTQTPKYNTPRADYQYEPMNIAPALQMFNDFTLRKAQVDNLRTQNSQIIQSTVTDAVRAANIAQNTAKSKFDLGLAKELRSNSLSVAQQNLRKMMADTDLSKQSLIESREKTRGMKVDTDLNEKLKKYGLTTGDSSIMRMLFNFIERPNKSKMFENLKWW